MGEISHNPYFNRWFSAIGYGIGFEDFEAKVTILILIDGFLQYKNKQICKQKKRCHNPYFNRWFSAILL